MKKIRTTLCAILVFGVAIPAVAGGTKVKSFENWPAGSSPREIGTRVAARFIASAHAKSGPAGAPARIIYPEVITWYGALTFAQLSGQKDLTAQLVKRFDPLFTTEAGMIPPPVNVDYTVFGAVPLELYIETGDQKYLDLGRSIVDKQWENPQPDGLSNQRAIGSTTCT